MTENVIGLEQARLNFAELVDRAHRGEAFLITRYGRPEAVLAPLASGTYTYDLQGDTVNTGAWRTENATDETPRRYASMSDVIEQEIRPALGEYADDFDVEAIARATFVWRIDTDDQGRQLLNSAGFEMSCADEAAFWGVVERHHH